MEIQQLTHNSYKFYTCKYRSEQEEEVVITRCSCKGGNYIDKGWVCNKKNIFKLNTNICNECDDYKQK
jgi:hypothetical protein